MSQELKQPITHDGELKSAIDRLENALLTPVLAGELVGWVNTVQVSADDVAEHLQPFFERLHSDFTEIAKADNELLYRVQQMVECEQQLRKQHEEFRRGLNHLAIRAPRVHSDEAKVADERLKVERQGTALLTELKRLQAAASTWLQEAVYRDRGPVD